MKTAALSLLLLSGVSGAAADCAVRGGSPTLRDVDRARRTAPRAGFTASTDGLHEHLNGLIGAMDVTMKACSEFSFDELHALQKTLRCASDPTLHAMYEDADDPRAPRHVSGPAGEEAFDAAFAQERALIGEHADKFAEGHLEVGCAIECDAVSHHCLRVTRSIRRVRHLFFVTSGSNDGRDLGDG